LVIENLIFYPHNPQPQAGHLMQPSCLVKEILQDGQFFMPLFGFNSSSTRDKPKETLGFEAAS